MRGRVEFSVRWSRGQRVFVTVVAVFMLCAFALIATAATFELTGADADPGNGWPLMGISLFFLAIVLLLLPIVRLAIWLDDDRLVKQGAFRRRPVSLRTATFRLTETTWQYTRRLGPLNVVKVNVTAPTLVVAESALRRVKLPLAQRTGHQVVGNRVIVSWLPQSEITALADAVERHAAADNKDKVVRYLRHLGGTPVQPRGAIEGVL